MFEILIRFGDWKGRTLARYGGKFFNLQVDVFRRFIGCARRKYQAAFALARVSVSVDAVPRRKERLYRAHMFIAHEVGREARRK